MMVFEENPGNRQGTAADAFCLLTDDALFTLIFEFVGLYEYRFVALLNKRFQRLYSECQKKRIHPAPEDSSRFFSIRYKYFSTSLTSTASVAESIERAKVLMSDTEDRECNYFIKLRKRERDGIYGSIYHVVKYRRISGTNQILSLLRDEVALRYGNLEMLQWLRRNGCPWHESACAEAAFNGHLEMLQWARVNGCPWSESTCSEAASNGHLEVLKWARANGCLWDESTCTIAANNGHLKVLQWARTNGCPWDESTCDLAVSNGHLEVLQWARANGCPWDESRMCERAASNGHLEVLKWLRMNGCPWYESTCDLAARNEHWEVLQWARANGCPHESMPHYTKSELLTLVSRRVSFSSTGIL